jgi:PAS domain S-box-containing protein
VPTHALEAIDFVRNVLLAIERAPGVAMYALDASGRVMYWNSCCTTTFGYERDLAVGQALADLVQRSGADEFGKQLATVWETAQPCPQRDWEIRLRDGSRRWLSSTMFPLIHDDRVHLVFCTDIDVTARRSVERGSYLADQVFEQGHDAILIADDAWRIVSVNQAYTRLTGRTLDDVKGALAPQLTSARHDDAFYESLRSQVLAEKHWQGEVWSERQDGELFPLWMSLTAILDAEGQVAGYVAVMSDISARKRDEEATRYLAEHDFLTGLPNRVLLLDRLQQGLAAARRQGSRMALMFVDLDHFKAINDTHGHAAGDAVLKEVAARLMQCVRGADTV